MEEVPARYELEVLNRPPPSRRSIIIGGRGALPRNPVPIFRRRPELAPVDGGILLAVPDAPERVKAVTSNEDAVVISWLPPRRPNGILTKYTVYIRVLDQGQEVKITKSSLPAQNLHHEVTGLKLRESYEAWVTASTKVGEGPSTPVIKLQLSNTGESSYRLYSLESGELVAGMSLDLIWNGLALVWSST